MSPVRAMAICILLILAGCVETEAPPDLAPEPNPVAGPGVTNNDTQGPEETGLGDMAPLDFEIEDCIIAAPVELVDLDQAASLVPTDFTALDASELIDTPGSTNHGALLHGWSMCGEFHIGLFGVFVRSPTELPQSAVDREFYVLETWTSWPVLSQWLDAEGIPHGNDTVLAASLTPAESPMIGDPDTVATPRPRTGEGSVTGNQSAALDFTLGGTTGYRTQNATFRFFFVADEMHILDITPRSHGTGSSGSCSYGSATNAYAQYTAQETCGARGVMGVTAGETKLHIVTEQL